MYTAVQKNRGHLFFAVLKRSRLVLTFYLSVSNNCFIFLIPGDQEGLFKLAIQLRKFLFITL
jgi:hypothetical protein